MDTILIKGLQLIIALALLILGWAVTLFCSKDFQS